MRGKRSSRFPWRWCAALALGAALCGAVESRAQAGGGADEFVAVSEPCLNLRPGPSLEDAPVRCLPPGRRMTLLESRGEWSRVRLPDGQAGWVASRLMRPVTEGASLEAPPAPEARPQAPAPEPRPVREPEVQPATEPPVAAEPESSSPAEPESSARPRELEAALEEARTERAELERALALIIQEEAAAKAEAEAAAGLREEIDDLTGLLRAAEQFLSESERQRLELAQRVADLERENRALRERLGEEPARAPERPESKPGREEQAESAGVLLPDTPLLEPEPEPEPEPRAPVTAVPEAPLPEAPPTAPVAALPEAEASAPEATPAEAPPAGATVEPEDPPSAGAPAAAPEPPATPAEPVDAGELMQTVTAWAKAWSEQRVEDYLAFYSGSFQPPGGRSRAEWEALRRRRVSAPARIEVKVALRDARVQGPTRAEIEFLQSYSSDTYSDTVVKTLELVREAGRWRIVRESSG